MLCQHATIVSENEEKEELIGLHTNCIVRLVWVLNEQFGAIKTNVEKF
jgi:hypothetical protein